jgi:hypothetical protein
MPFPSSGMYPLTKDQPDRPRNRENTKKSSGFVLSCFRGDPDWY